jgi:hypothetical protein
MPSLDDARKGRGQIDLAEFAKNLVIGPKHFHQAAALIGDDLKRLDANFVNQGSISNFSFGSFVTQTIYYNKVIEIAGQSGAAPIVRRGLTSLFFRRSG